MLPLLTLAESSPQRFEVQVVQEGDTRRHKFAYMARTRFRTLWRSIYDMGDDAGLAAQVVQGSRRSHLLAATTVLLIPQGVHCVYVGDTHQLVRDFVTCMRDALILAYASDEETLMKVGELVTIDAVLGFIKSRQRGDLIFVIDNWDALRSQEGSIAGEVQKWISEMTYVHHLVLATSSNDRTVRKRDEFLAQTGFRHLCFFEGFSDVSDAIR